MRCGGCSSETGSAGHATEIAGNAADIAAKVTVAQTPVPDCMEPITPIGDFIMRTRVVIEVWEAVNAESRDT
jgi:hypothetical protein